MLNIKINLHTYTYVKVCLEGLSMYQILDLEGKHPC